MIFGLKKFHKYLFGRTFTIVTDHLPLVSLFGEGKRVPEIASPRVQRWALTLSAYEYKIVFKPGRNHGNSECFNVCLCQIQKKMLKIRIGSCF